MEYDLNGLGMAVAVSPRRMSLTLMSSPRKGADAGAPAGAGASGDARGASPTTVLYRAFEGVAAAGASPRTASDDGTESASPADAAAGLQRHLTRAQALVGEGHAAAQVLGELELFDVTEHLALQTRVLKAERNLLDAQLASDEGALSHIQAMSAAVAEVDDVAAVALSMARLSVLDDAEARLEALRQRQRAMVDSLLVQLKLQREGLRNALDEIAPGLDAAPRRAPLRAAPEAALAQALEAAVEEREAPSRRWGARLLRFAKAQLPGILCGALGVVAVAAVRRTASRVSAARAEAAAAAEAADEAAEMASARAAAAMRRRRLAEEHVDLEELGYTRVAPRADADVSTTSTQHAASAPPPADDALRGEVVASVAIPVAVGAAAAHAASAAEEHEVAPPAVEEEHVLEV